MGVEKEEEIWAFCYFIFMQILLQHDTQSHASFSVIACFVDHSFATDFVSLLWTPAKDALLTTCSLSYIRRLPRLIFFALSSCWFMAFPYVAIKVLESPLRDELMPLKYISVSCPLMVLFKNKGRIGAACFLLKFSFPLL